ncbi:transglutaminase domain-containing protein [Demequina globuliformis]|uniref:transglutaminase domain-containing protein n=1 Tax=Demequina globuliformis TaxID=676202 RepID=UPI0007804400|nr:transglutaminase domain-containing protein [Demequina globuliformis]
MVLTLAIAVVTLYVYQLALAQGYLPAWANIGTQIALASQPSAPEVAYPVYGSSELVTYIAAHTVAQSARIDVTHWARTHSTEHVGDAVLEAFTQNPYAYVDGYRVSDDGTSVVLEPTYVYSADEAEHRRAVTSQAVTTGLTASGADVATTDSERVTRIHDYIATIADYDYAAYELINNGVLDDPRVQQSQEAYGIFSAATAVCNGYAQAFLAMAKAAGVDVVQVTGTVSSGMTVGNHAWNKVRIDGQWVVVDVTWDDPDVGLAPGREYLMLPPGDAALVTRVEDSNWVVDTALLSYA